MPKLPPPDAIRKAELVFERITLAPSRWIIEWAYKTRFKADLTYIRQARANVQKMTSEAAGFAAGDAMLMKVARASETVAVAEEILPTAAHLVDDVAHQHAGNAGKWVKQITDTVSKGLEKH
jgi:hypothetical protein